jgi:hypothetical protein
MIYEAVEPESPIRQGDLFVGLPRVILDLSQMTVVESGSPSAATYVESWETLQASGREIQALFPIESVSAIVITQDCDALRAADITLCVIRPFAQVEGMARTANSPKAWMKILTQHARLNLKWFYLPPGEAVGFTEKMAVDFRSPIRVPGDNLHSLRRLRRGRLNSEADEHFRERLSEFFRRYPYDEWYPLNAEEFGEYRKSYSDAEPREWQRS